MLVQFHLTDNELQAFFANAGYKTTYKNEMQFRSAYHNREEPFDMEVLHVVDDDGMSKPAKEVFEAAMKLRVTQPDELTKQAIKTVLNNNKTQLECTKQ